MTQRDDDQATPAEELEAECCAGGADPSRRHVTLTFLRGSVVSLAIAGTAGLLGVLYYIPAVAPVMRGVGLEFTSLRPIHTTFAAAFIFLGGVAMVHRYFEDVAGPMGRAERLRTRLQVVLWALAGLGVLVSLLSGVYSGREYLGFHPVLSVPILLGWLLFTWNFVAHLGSGLLHRPVHVTMWLVGLMLFVYTFLEQHGWLLPGVYSDPLVDLRVQWKATGTLVGSMNLFVYGSLYYLACKLSGCEKYAHSHLAYALFGVGLLNTFTNFGHHTYHLPQSDAIKWISFVISMTEIVLLVRVVWDIAAMFKSKCAPETCVVRLFIVAAKWWTAFILATSIVISVPPLNALIHGTPVIMGHGMGAEIGIDGMILFAAFCWMLREIGSRRGTESCTLDYSTVRRWVIGLNIGVASLVGWLTVSGTVIGVYRYDNLAPPRWIESSNAYVLAVCGGVTAWFLGRLLVMWLRELFPRRSDSAISS